MDKNFCRQIDQESLVEQYVAGKLRGELLDQFEEHLKDCQDHAGAVLLEKALKRGVSEFARGEIKSKLRHRLKKREDARYMMLRYAAILLVAVITPLLLYYQINIAPDEIAESISEKEEVVRDEVTIKDGEEKQLTEKPPKVELKSRKSAAPAAQGIQVSPAAGGLSSVQESERSSINTKDTKILEISDDKKTKSSDMQELLKSVKATAPAKIEADHPLEEDIQTTRGQLQSTAILDQSQERQSTSLINEINNKIKEDSLSIRACVDNYLGDPERDTYEIQILIQVLNGGKIGELKLVRTTHPSSDLESCLFNMIKTYTLPVEVGTGNVLQKITY